MSKRHKRQEKPAEVILPITPMLDMTFQLMAFFIFTSTRSRSKAKWTSGCRRERC